jgi:hypothetical protein
MFKENKYYYFPSYFLESNLSFYKHDFNLLEYISNEQYYILSAHSTLMNNYIKEVHDIHSTILNEYITEVHGILSEYKNFNDRMLL